MATPIKRPCPGCGAEPLRLHAPGCVYDVESAENGRRPVSMMLHSLTAEAGDVREYGFALRKDGGDTFVTVGVQMCTGEVKRLENTRPLSVGEWRAVLDFIHRNEHHMAR